MTCCRLIKINRVLLAWLGLIVWLLAHSSGAMAAVWYVNTSATGTGSGANWANATTLQGALTATVSGDQLWVAAGIYKPDEGPGQTNNASSSTFNIRPGLAVYGGFVGTETALSQRNLTTNVTVLSGDIDGNDTNADGNFIAETQANIVGTNALHVVTMDGTTGTPITSTTRLDGFTITAGTATGTSSPALEYGGGFHCNGSGVNSNCSSKLVNVTFSGNTATSYGGAMFNWGDSGISSPRLTNSILWDNTAPNDPQIFNNAATPIVTYSVVEGGYVNDPVIDNPVIITGDPKLGSLQNNGGPTLTLALGAGSSAIDAGTNTGCPATD